MESANNTVIEVILKLSKEYLILNHNPTQQFSTVTTIMALVLARWLSSWQSLRDLTCILLTKSQLPFCQISHSPVPMFVGEKESDKEYPALSSDCRIIDLCCGCNTARHVLCRNISLLIQFLSVDWPYNCSRESAAVFHSHRIQSTALQWQWQWPQQWWHSRMYTYWLGRPSYQLTFSLWTHHSHMSWWLRHIMVVSEIWPHHPIHTQHLKNITPSIACPEAKWHLQLHSDTHGSLSDAFPPPLNCDNNGTLTDTTTAVIEGRKTHNNACFCYSQDHQARKIIDYSNVYSNYNVNNLPIEQFPQEN